MLQLGQGVTMKYIGKWSRYEVVYLLIFSTIICAVATTFNDPTMPDWFNTINIISAVSGIVCVILVAKRNILNFLIGIINVVLYGYISYVYHWNGSMILNWFIFFPFQFIGWYYWKDNLDINLANVKTKIISGHQWLIIVMALFVGITIDMMFLRTLPTYVSFINAQNIPLLDSISTNFSIVATILMTYRYAEQWILWIAIDIVTIIMWIYSFIIDGNGALPVLIMWIAFLVNALYGWYMWRRL